MNTNIIFKLEKGDYVSFDKQGDILYKILKIDYITNEIEIYSEYGYTTTEKIINIEKIYKEIKNK